jgi:hypothetical protein
VPRPKTSSSARSPSKGTPTRRAAGDFAPTFSVLELKARRPRAQPTTCCSPVRPRPLKRNSTPLGSRRPRAHFDPLFCVLEIRARQPWSPEVFRLGIKSSRPCDRTGNHFLRRRAVVLLYSLTEDGIPALSRSHGDPISRGTIRRCGGAFCRIRGRRLLTRPAAGLKSHETFGRTARYRRGRPGWPGWVTLEVLPSPATTQALPRQNHPRQP